MDNSTYEKLISISRTNRVEKSGYMLGTRDGQDFYVTSIELQSDEAIESSSKTRIAYNMKHYLMDIILRASSLENTGALICFHTHPSLQSSIDLSEADIDMLNHIQSLVNKVVQKNNDAEITVVEGVINWSEIAFYSINPDTGRIERCPLFVDGMEFVPSKEGTFLQNIKDGFMIGRKKAKRK